MRNWRIISTIAAVVLAAIAGVLVWKYLTNADNRAEKQQGPGAGAGRRSRRSPGARVFDQALADKLFETKQIPKRLAAAGLHHAGHATTALLDALQGQGRRAPTSSPARRSSPTSSWQPSQLVSTVAGAIPKGNAGHHVSLDQTPRRRRLRDAGRQGERHPQLPGHGHDGGQRTCGTRRRRSCSRASRCIAVGSSTILPQRRSRRHTSERERRRPRPPRRQTQPASLITLQVTPRQAEQIVQGTTLGTVWLSLNPPDFNGRQLQEPDRDRRRRSTCSTSR